MRKLNEQWVENGRMYKAVEGIHCSGCCYNEGDQGCYISGKGCPTDNGETDLVIRDLGPVNEGGLLAEERTGLFPQLYLNKIRHKFVCFVQHKGIRVETTGETWQQAIDAWNRRAR